MVNYWYIFIVLYESFLIQVQEGFLWDVAGGKSFNKVQRIGVWQSLDKAIRQYWSSASKMVSD